MVQPFKQLELLYAESPLQNGGNSTRNGLKLGLNLAADAYGLQSFSESARQLALACEIVGLPFTVNDIQWHPRLYSLYRKFFPHQFDLTLNRCVSVANPYPINVIRLLTTGSERLFASNPRYFEGKINVAWWSWDFPRIPSEWLKSCRLFDEVWVTSEFMRRNMADVLPITVRRISYPLTVNEALIDRRKVKFGVNEDVYVFLFAFEYCAGFERKNPIALIEAFKRAFNRSDRVLLVIKTMPLFSSSVNPLHTVKVWKRAREKARSLDRAVKAAADSAKIMVLNGRFARSDFTSLLAASDCYVSLHRSEGFGQVLAQSMYLAKPVIATGYSGNLDYMNKDNSLLIRNELVKVNERDPDYHSIAERNVWAEPDINHASQLMRWVYEHPDEAKGIGKRAARSIRELTNPMTVGKEVLGHCSRLIMNE